MAEEKLTERLIDFALNTKYEDIPAEVIGVQKRSLLDSIGVMAAATTLEAACTPFMDFAEENSGKKDCTIIGTNRKASVTMAAMANGALIHAMDYEDGHDAAKAHPNTAGIPVSLALGESLGKSGTDMLAAMVVSSELCCRLKMSLLDSDLEHGWYSPPMFSAYGAVLGASRLLGLSDVQARDALSICMTQVMLPGQSAISGESVLRAVRDAFSAKAAVYGALLAQKGVAARMDAPFEGRLGLFKAIAQDRYSPDLITDGLGESWESAKLRFKPWPCCGTTHAVLDTLLSLVHEYGVRPEETEDVHLTVNPIHMNVLSPREAKYRPHALAAAKFSLPFTVALGLKNRAVTLNMYREEALQNPELLSLADKVTYTVREMDSSKPRSFYNDDHVVVSLRTRRGVFSRETYCSSGSVEKPLDDNQIRAKFFDCMSYSEKGFSAKECQRIFNAVQAFEKVTSLKNFFDA